MSKHLLLTISLLAPVLLWAQQYLPDNQIPVYDLQGDSLVHAWAGGMNNPQVNTLDLNQDGWDDIVVFDRMDASYTVYLNNQIANEASYTLDNRYSANFDSCGCTTWFLLADYTCDGRDDVFCGDEQGRILVYEQVVYGDSVGFEARFTPLFSQYFNQLPLSVPKTDLPALADMDGDGDLDIVTPQNGFNTFAYHRNLAQENGRCDTLMFERETFCWGQFIESNADNTLALGDTVGCPLPADFDRSCIPEMIRQRGQGGLGPVQGGPRHAGSTLLVLDIDDNGLMDIMLGDISFPSVTAAFNNGCVEYAFMDSLETHYPRTDSSIDMPIFPAMFWEDINNDSKKDLVITPNEIADGENVNGMLWYENEGTNALPDFRFRDRTFLAGQMIDIGNFSSPAFFDYDEDGLMDMMVGHASARYKNDTASDVRYELHLYRNTGTLENPAFTLADSNFLNFSNLPSLLNFTALGAGDLDGDGDQDILLGYQGGKLAYFENAGSPGQPGVYVRITTELTDANGDTIDVGGLSSPELYDLDDDGDLDLFIGEEHGWINYYENVGDSSQFSFSLVTESFGDIKLSNSFNNPFSGNSKPRIFDYDGDGNAELLVGGIQGFVEVYGGIEFGTVSSLSLKETLFSYDFGSMASPAVAVLDTSGNPVYVVGNRRGGLQLFRQKNAAPDTTTSIGDLPQIPSPKVYPNPNQGQFEVEFAEGQFAAHQLEVRNSMGQLVWQTNTRRSAESINITAYPKGVYFLQIQQQGRRWTYKIVVQ